MRTLLLCILCILVACSNSSSSTQPTSSTQTTTQTSPSTISPQTAPAPQPNGSNTSTSTNNNNVTVRVDRRIELLSILHRLIGHTAYTSGPATPYVKAVDVAFTPFANHPAVVATRALRASHSITWDAPLLLAAHLDDQLQLRNPDELPLLDPRFTGADLVSYAATLRDFARDSKLDEFLTAHHPYVTAVEAGLRIILDQAKPVPWFDAFFGAKAKARYIVVPGLLTGNRNFGVRATLPDGTQEFYQVLGIRSPDGMPLNDDLTVALLVHEMAHSYVNPLIDANRAAFESAGATLFALVEAPMKKQAYNNWKTFVDESLVRAVVVLYTLDRNGQTAANQEAQQQIRNEFRWTPVLAKLLLRYQTERAKYADFAAFMPELIKTFNTLAADGK